MRILEIKGVTGNSRIVVGESLQNLKNYLPNAKRIIITDENINQLYRDKFPSAEIIVIGTGEQIKTLSTVEWIYEKLVDIEADRSAFIVGIGGGIVCDITGFIASTYMRGVRFGFVSTTLLAQVDASVGGKNGVNFKGYKNMIGNFNQPEFVICDMNLLKTLPEEEKLCGFGEIAKHAFIGDERMCLYLEQNYVRALALDEEVIARLVYDSVVIKSTVVNADEREKGERKKLNFGHTFGHAVEKTTGMLHGQAISIGMVAAAKLSVKRGLLQPAEVKRIETLLERLKLPVTTSINPEMMIDAIRKDKKRAGNFIDYVLLERVGKATIEKISVKELERVIFHA